MGVGSYQNHSGAGSAGGGGPGAEIDVQGLGAHLSLGLLWRRASRWSIGIAAPSQAGDRDRDFCTSVRSR